MNKTQIFLWIAIIITLVIFFLTKTFWVRIALGCLLFILIIKNTSILKKDYSNKIFEAIGVGMISGFIVSLYRDIATGNPIIYPLYIAGFAVAIVLLIIGISGKA